MGYRISDSAPFTGQISGARILRNTFYAQFGVYLASSFTSTLGTFIDGIIIGQYLGLDAIAAFGIVSPLFLIFTLGGAIVSTGARNLFIQHMSQGKRQDAQAVFSLSCILSAGIAICMMLAVLLLSTPLIQLLGARGSAADLLPKAKGYLLGNVIGLPFRNLMWVLWAYMSLDNDRNLPLIASITMTITNIAADLISVIYLHGSTFEMGLATSISYTAALLVLLTHFLKKDILLRFSFRNIPWRETGIMVRQGLPAGFSRIGNTVRCTFLNHLLSIIASSVAIAAYSVQRQADSLLNPFTLGMADTVAVMAGILVGEQDLPMIRRLFYTYIRATIMITVSISAVVWIGAPQFASLYVLDDPTALRLSVRAVRCYAVGMPLYARNIIYENYVLGLGKNRLASVTGIMLECLLPILAACILSSRLGGEAVWAAFPAAQVFTLLYYRCVMEIECRHMGIRKEPFRNRVLLLPAAFDVPETDRMDVSIQKLNDVMDLAMKVGEFCKAHGCDPRRTYLLSLAVEEMVGNVVEHGFTKDRRRHSVDVRILKKEGDYILRIRDDCRFFDPIKRLELFSDSDPAHHIGLRLITGTAKDVQYTYLLNLNHLVIRI